MERRVQSIEHYSVAAKGEAVEQRGRHPLVAEDLVPAGELQVGRHQHAPAVVALAEELEEELRPLGVEGQVAEFVNNNKIEGAELLEEFVEAILVLGDDELVGQRGGRAEGDAVALLAAGLPVSYTHLRAHETDS